MTTKTEILEVIKNSTEVLKALVEITAIIIAGLFTYYKFFRGRVFNTRLKTSVTGRITRVDGRNILVAIGRIENVGTANIKIKKNGCTLRVTTYTASNTKGIGTPVDGERAAYPIFPNDESIESYEVLENQRLVPIDIDYVAIGLELYVFSQGSRTWYTSTLIERPKETT